MKISVVMPCRLEPYEGQCNTPVKKFIRAVKSFQSQIHADRELIIVSDGSNAAERIYNNHFRNDKRIRFIKIEKQPLFSGYVRQEGVDVAEGEIICYLDADDFIGVSHIAVIAQAFKDFEEDWFYFNDYIHASMVRSQIRDCVLAKGKCGTSNIAHLKSVNVGWGNCNGYGHDWDFIQKLINEYKHHKKIYGCSYYCCHIPGLIDN